MLFSTFIARSYRIAFATISRIGFSFIGHSAAFCDQKIKQKQETHEQTNPTAMKCKPACAGPLSRSLVDSGPESTISFGLWACVMLCGMQGEVCSAPFLCQGSWRSF